MNEKFTKLAEPFPPEDIEWRAGATTSDKTKALALAYITSRAIMNRLDDVVGPENWRDEYAPGPNGGVVCGLSLRVGDEWITKWDGADNSDIEGIKGGLSDAFKRAGYKWGIGRYLYKLDGVWVKCEAFGKTVKLTETPKLPAWAIPNGSKPAQQKPAPAATTPPATLPDPKAKTNGNGTNGHTSPTGNGEKPPRYTPEALREALTKSAGLHRANNIQIKDTDRNMLAVNLENCFAGEADSEHKRHVVINYFFGVDSVKDLDAAQVTAIKRWLNVTKDDGGEWRPAANAVKEAKAVYRAALIAEGQQELIPA